MSPRRPAEKRLQWAMALLVVAASVAWVIWSLVVPGNAIRNVVLISIDTCRSDRLGCYGYRADATPNIDAVAAEGLLFENAIASAPLTLPSHATMMTGVTPPRHGARDNVDFRLGESNTTLAEILKREGFETGAIVSSFVLDRRFGLSQGFDDYEGDFKEKYRGDKEPDQKGGETTRLALDWLDRRDGDPFFLFLHYYDAHDPYEPPEPQATRFKDDLYAGEIAFVDACIGRIIGKLRERELEDSTLLIIVGDHGESLGEHGEDRHGFFLYESAIRVPLIIRHPRIRQARRVADRVGVIDVTPTVLGALGLPVPAEMSGQNLMDYFDENPPSNPDRIVYSEAMTPTLYQCSPLFAVSNGEWKYIQTARPELYRLSRDPGEEKNLLDAEPEIASGMKAELEAILEDESRDTRKESVIELDKAAIKRLNALGYLGGASSASAAMKIDEKTRDPKDYIRYHVFKQNAMGLFVRGRYEEARKLCREILSFYPDEAFVHHMLGNTAFEARDWAEAIQEFDQALLLSPDQSSNHEIHALAGVAAYQLGQTALAIKHFEKSIELNPENPMAQGNLGVALFASGRIDEAIVHWREAVRLNPRDDVMLNNLASALYNKGERAEGIERWKASLRANPNQPRVRRILDRERDGRG